jgi:DUF438 domain-containing protein
MTTKDELKQVLKQLKNEGDAAFVKEKSAQFLKKIDAKTLSLAEQELLHEGFTRDDLMRLCDVHLRVLGEALEEEPRAAAAHPIAILVSEHKVILKNLDDLQRIIDILHMAKGYDDIEHEIKRLVEIADFLLNTESHHQREEQVLFPRLERHGVTGPPRIMRIEHEELRARKQKLAQVVKAARTMEFADFVKGVQEAGGYLTANLRGHIFKEDNILYPTALETLSNEEWHEVLAEFDRLGYCSFTPGKRPAPNSAD